MRLFRPVPRVTLAQSSDAPGLAELYARASSDFDEVLDERMVDDLIPSLEEVTAWFRGGFEIYRAALGGALVGAVRCSFPTSACHIDHLAVDPDFRGKGFGQVLVEHAVNRARRAGVTRAWAQVSPKAEAALKLFRGLGFRESGRHNAQYWGESLVLLELPL